MSAKPEYIRCIADEATGQTWCGKTSQRYDCNFVDVTHAACNGRAEGRLVCCQECASAVEKALANGAAIAPPVAAGSAYDKTSIQINRCKRILELVDTYVDCLTQDHRTELRKALMDEFEAPPMAAGSVNTAPFRLLFTGYSSDADNVAEFVNAWGAQQREAGKAEQTTFLKECMVRGQEDFNRKWTEQKERAEKAEAEAARAWKSRNEMISNFNLNNELFRKEVDTLKVIQQSIYKELKEKNSVLSKLETLLRSEIDHATFNNHRLPAGMALEGEYAVRASCIEACIEGAKCIEV